MILYLNSLDNPITWNKKQYLLRAAERLGITNVRPLLNNTPDRDYVLNIEPYSFVKGNVWTGLWEIDLLCDRPETGRDWPYADTVFVAGSHYADKLSPNTTLLFQACDPELHYPQTPKVNDFVISGMSGAGLYQERSDALEILKEKYTFADIGKDRSIIEYIKGISTAKIQFIRSMSSKIAEGELAQRFFECLAIGPVLTNYIDDLEKTGLIEGEDYLAYRTIFELEEKFDYLLNTKGMAEKIARNGRKKALMYHTYEHRLVTILNTIKEYEIQRHDNVTQ